MTPSELYALPDLVTQAWHETGGRTLRLAFEFGFDLDDERGEAEKDETVRVHEKLSCFIDGGERTATVAVLSFEGRPFGYTASAGRGERDFEAFTCTDADLHRAARDHLRRYELVEEDRLELADADAEDPVLSGFHGVRVATAEDGAVVLVRADRLSRDGELMFDDRAFRAAFDRLVRPLGVPSGPAMADDAFKDRFADAILEAVPERFAPFKVDRNPGGDAWIAVAFSTDDSSHALYVPGHALKGVGFSSVSTLGIGRMGGPEAAESLRAELSEAPRPR